VPRWVTLAGRLFSRRIAHLRLEILGSGLSDARRIWRPSNKLEAPPSSAPTQNLPHPHLADLGSFLSSIAGLSIFILILLRVRPGLHNYSHSRSIYTTVC
jgi:hypothetical protein